MKEADFPTHSNFLSIIKERNMKNTPTKKKKDRNIIFEPPEKRLSLFIIGKYYG